MSNLEQPAVDNTLFSQDEKLINGLCFPIAVLPSTLQENGITQDDVDWAWSNLSQQIIEDTTEMTLGDRKAEFFESRYSATEHPEIMVSLMSLRLLELDTIESQNAVVDYAVGTLPLKSQAAMALGLKDFPTTEQAPVIINKDTESILRNLKPKVETAPAEAAPEADPAANDEAVTDGETPTATTPNVTRSPKINHGPNVRIYFPGVKG